MENCSFYFMCSVGYQAKPCTESFSGTSDKYLTDQVAKIAEIYKNKLHQVAEAYHKVGVKCLLSIYSIQKYYSSAGNINMPIFFISTHAITFLSEI